MTGRHGAKSSTRTPQTPSGLSREQRLAETCVELADTLIEGFDVIEFLHTLTDRCVELLDVSAAGLMFGDRRGRLRVAASSSEETWLLELFQLQNNEGPCLECYQTGEPVDERDLVRADARWPLFAPEAVRAGFRTVHALPMRLRERTVGSLNLFHTRPDAFPPEAMAIAQSLVNVATIGLLQVESGHRSEVLLSQLEIALEARVVIEQAKGVLAELSDVTPAQAFTLLRTYALENGIRLTDLAHTVLERDLDFAELWTPNAAVSDSAR